jgi:predicted nucleotidyltransferase
LRSFRDRDYLRTHEGFIFAVIGNVHPTDRVIAYLKYIPDEHGKWGRGRLRYRRALPHYNVPSVMDSMRFLLERAPEYVFESNVHGIALPAVPADRIAEHLRPEERLLQIYRAQEHDKLEDKTLRLAELISENAGVSAGSLGVTGSLLARIHDPAFSDIDLVVYGRGSALRARSFLLDLSQFSSASIRRLTRASRQKWIAERVKSSPLSQQQAIALLARKWNIGLFEGTEFSIHAVHTETEVLERYGDERYVPLGIVNAVAKVQDSGESLFMPAVYRVESANLQGSYSAYTVDRIVTFEGLYAGIASDGETVSCRGKLERVESSLGIGHRIVVGSPEAEGTDFILPCETGHEQ